LAFTYDDLISALRVRLEYEGMFFYLPSPYLGLLWHA